MKGLVVVDVHVDFYSLDDEMKRFVKERWKKLTRTQVIWGVTSSCDFPTRRSHTDNAALFAEQWAELESIVVFPFHQSISSKSNNSQDCFLF